MRAAVLAATTALSLLLPNPALANSWAKRAAAILRTGNVELTTGRFCNGMRVATYTKINRTIDLCPLAFATEQSLKEAIAHEAIHAAQHCAGLAKGRDTYRPLGLVLLDGDYPNGTAVLLRVVNDAQATKSRQIASSNPTGSLLIKMLESEAYGFESYPDDAIGIFQLFCTNTPPS